MLDFPRCWTCHSLLPYWPGPPPILSPPHASTGARSARTAPLVPTAAAAPPPSPHRGQVDGPWTPHLICRSPGDALCSRHCFTPPRRGGRRASRLALSSEQPACRCRRERVGRSCLNFSRQLNVSGSRPGRQVGRGAGRGGRAWRVTFTHADIMQTYSLWAGNNGFLILSYRVTDKITGDAVLMGCFTMEAMPWLGR